MRLFCDPNVERASNGQLRVCLDEGAAGGAAPDPTTVEWLKGQFPGGAAYHESYGCTECGAVAEDGALMERSTGRFAEGKLLELGPGAGAAGYPWPQFGEMVVRTPTMASGSRASNVRSP